MKINLKLKDALRRIFNKHDLIDIYENKKINFDEYDPEIRLVLKKIKRDMTLENFTDELHKIFVKMFDERIAGPKSKYKKLSKEVYDFLTKN